MGILDLIFSSIYFLSSSSFLPSYYKMDSAYSSLENTPIFESASGEIIREVQKEEGHFSMAHVYIPPGKGSYEHYHPEITELYHVTKGECEMRLNGEKRTLKKGESVYIKPNVRHKIWNFSNEDFEMLVTCVPPFYPGSLTFAFPSFAPDKTRKTVVI